MDNDIFIHKGIFDDLEINTSDGNNLYVPRGWLVNTSDYFKAMFTNGLFESNSNTINLSYKSKVIRTLLFCILRFFLGADYIKKLLVMLDNTTDVCQFLNACNEYQFDNIKLIADDFFSLGEKIRLLFNVELVTTVKLLKLPKMKTSITNLFYKNPLVIEPLKDKTSLYILLDVFETWETIIEILELLIRDHNPTDEELFQTKLSNCIYNTLPHKCTEKIVRTIRKINNADKFKLKCLEKLSYVLFPEKN
jgi:BTB/POZ domain